MHIFLAHFDRCHIGKILHKHTQLGQFLIIGFTSSHVIGLQGIDFRCAIEHRKHKALHIVGLMFKQDCVCSNFKLAQCKTGSCILMWYHCRWSPHLPGLNTVLAVWNTTWVCFSLHTWHNVLTGLEYQNACQFQPWTLVLPEADPVTTFICLV